MTSFNFFGTLPALTVYEDRLDGTDRKAYTVYGHDEALAFAGVLVSNGSSVEIVPQNSIILSVEELEEIEEDFAEENEPELPDTTDGYFWAKKFVAVQADYGRDPTDLEWVHGWFANAIEAGRNAERNTKDDVINYGPSWDKERVERPEDRHQGFSDPLG